MGDSMLDYNMPPLPQPGSWCKWVYHEDTNEIRWSGSEKFYGYFAWLKYLIDRVLSPKGYKLTGSVFWRGEDPEDRGVIAVIDNVFKVYVDRGARPQMDISTWPCGFGDIFAIGFEGGERDPARRFVHTLHVKAFNEAKELVDTKDIEAYAAHAEKQRLRDIRKQKEIDCFDAFRPVFSDLLHAKRMTDVTLLVSSTAPDSEA
eukprot:TRINITY_DN26958_c0_g1_i1.p2 TRINITY_DN26958_c0_g1~~TRINITY_DN26958_c0_g1_i1.p2  ORF type:complete len:203 (-),score=53.46 TRINITY_DN26958_c0_g1_i1:404-1012(-)